MNLYQNYSQQTTQIITSNHNNNTHSTSTGDINRLHFRLLHFHLRNRNGQNSVQFQTRTMYRILNTICLQQQCCLRRNPQPYTLITLLFGYLSPTNCYTTTDFRLYSAAASYRLYRRRVRKRLNASTKPVLDQAQFERAVSLFPPRLTADQLYDVLTLQIDPLLCLELFHWASMQPRFKHDESTYHVTIRKLGSARMYVEMDALVDQLLAVACIGSETLYNTIIHFFIEARKLTRAVHIFKHMRNNRNLAIKPSIRTYNLLYTGFLRRGSNSYINHAYMGTIRCLFKQMVNDGVYPDIYSLNSMIKGYVLSLHVNDALRIFHQMEVVYNCRPNSFSYDYLIHGLCSQERTNNARELCVEMKEKGFVPSAKSYNSLVNALAIAGQVDEAVKYLWEMNENRRSTDFITYQTILDEICRRGRSGEAMILLGDLQKKTLMDGHTYRKLLNVLEGDYGNEVDWICFR